MRPLDIILAKDDTSGEPDPDRAALDRALDEAGLKSSWCAWNDNAAEWSRAAVCVPRATWDYYQDPEAFLAWTRRVHAESELINPPAVIAWNLHKRYLLDLRDAGLPTVPTTLLERGDGRSLADLRAETGWEKVVLKPAISCASFETHVVKAKSDGEPHWTRLLAKRDMLVQPYIDSVDDEGERSLVTIDGKLTHVMRKRPRFHGGQERVDGPYKATAHERQLADAVLAWCKERLPPLAYARIDVVQDPHGLPMIAELELIEPSLFFDAEPRSLDRFVAMLERRLG